MKRSLILGTAMGVARPFLWPLAMREREERSVRLQELRRCNSELESQHVYLH